MGIFQEAYTPSCKLEKRFWAKVNKEGTIHPVCGQCWEWTAHLFPDGYGAFSISHLKRKRKYGAHRVSWWMHNGVLPEGMLVLHRCDNPMCVNPSHLWLGTNQDNVTDCKNKGRMGYQVHPDRVAKGEDTGSNKLTEEEVLYIRRVCVPRDPVHGCRALARRFKVNLRTILAIVKGTKWKYLLNKA